MEARNGYSMVSLLTEVGDHRLQHSDLCDCCLERDLQQQLLQMSDLCINKQFFGVVGLSFAGFTCSLLALY